MNTESTVSERLRMVIGILLTIVGSVTFTIGGFMHFSGIVWIIGVGLIILGYLVARSMKLIDYIITLR